MGNNAATGHLVNKGHQLGVLGGFGYKPLQLMIQQHNIVPWDPQSLLQRHMELQQGIAKTCPLRYIGVKAGSEHFGGKAQKILPDINGVVGLSREKFVELSLALFQNNGLHIHPDEAKRFYDAFDSIDADKNARLSPMELAVGLPAFFGGTVADRCNATFDVLDSNGHGYITVDELYYFIQPFVCIMVPRNVAVVRPFLTSKVTEQLMSEMTMGAQGVVNRQQFVNYMQMGFSDSAMVANGGTMQGNHIMNRAAQIIDSEVKSAFAEYQRDQSLRAYGQQTWQAQNGGQQRLMDVGAVRYVKNAAQAAPPVAPTVVAGTTALSSGAAQLTEHLTTFYTDVSQGITDMWGQRGRGDSLISVESATPTNFIGSQRGAPTFAMPAGTTSISVGTTSIQPASSRTRGNSEILPPPPPAAPAVWPGAAEAASPVTYNAPPSAVGTASPSLTSLNLSPQTTALSPNSARMPYQPTPALQTLAPAPSFAQPQPRAAQQMPAYAGYAAPTQGMTAYRTMR